MIKKKINNVEFKLSQEQDFSWIENYGNVFAVIDETGSGCINFGVEKDGEKYFFKISGAKTVESELTEQESINLLKYAVKVHSDIKHPNLIAPIKTFEINEFYVVVFKWVEAECLFDHWNFDKYDKDSSIITPKQKFNNLKTSKKLEVIKKLFSFFKTVINSGYVAQDFYDSSIMYYFESNEVYFCDIDLFRKMPTKNNLGKDYPGTKRLKAPEENELGEIIDEKTSEFTLGAIIFDMLSRVSNNTIRYERGMFVPESYENFELNENTYNVLLKATNYIKQNRYATIAEFEKAFLNSLN